MLAGEKVPKFGRKVSSSHSGSSSSSSVTVLDKLTKFDNPESFKHRIFLYRELNHDTFIPNP
jgi:hypothetical protein